MELTHLVHEVTGRDVTAETRLEDIDSLDRIELAVRIEEHFGTLIDATVLTQHPTLGELAGYLGEA